ncbi:hypothetical protein [Bartonella grahamii]|uniref:hypothetical protein n=1 Tax=Bartonella grahamii TaxID=33045 RepID=UPI002E7BB08B|nr:hypothetical protein [Bartonella grahamii]
MYRTQNVTVHVNGARDPVAAGQTVAYAIQRARANVLHGEQNEGGKAMRGEA